MNPNNLPPSLALPAPLPGKYLLPDDAKAALQLARVRPRPLLVVGEAGVGKSHLALALAEHWRVPFLKFVVQSTTQAEDLMWRFDAVQRLAEAQVLGASGCKQEEVTEKLSLERFLQPGVLWWAWNWSNAAKHVEVHQVQEATPGQPEGWRPEVGCVVLIDEIDKATADVPNNLLDVLDTGAITLPTGRRLEPQGAKPLIVITSNGDRELPAPFLRRCYVLNLSFPKEHAVPWLIQRAEAHFGKALHKDVLKHAAEQLVRDRLATSDSQYKPGVSEYLDLLYAVKELSADKKTQMKWVTDLGKFVLKSNSAI